MTTITFDTETTGIDPDKDRIIELCAWEEGMSPRTWRFRPLIPVGAEALSVHGITMEDLAECPTFEECADEIHTLFQGASSVVGYNVQFDIDMLQAEFERLGYAWDLTCVAIVDPLKLWYAKEKRTLGEAHRRFVGNELEGAHDAEVDVLATGRVLDGMLKSFDLCDLTMAELAHICHPERATWVGSTNHFVWNDAGQIVFGFGKHKGRPVMNEQGYLKWMQGGTFPRAVQNTISAILSGELKR